MKAGCFLFLFSLCGCAAAQLDVIRVGPAFVPRRESEVEVFSSRSETRRQWGGIGIIHGKHIPASSEKMMESQRRKARAAAAKLGADGVIIVFDAVSPGPDLGTYHEPEVYLSALAIKYAATASTPIAK
ncbi:MAG TPA: hypothetical protein DCZ92_13635 [Elusimicrobia bacterium]|nr:MAG: hypothetical protein A2016_08645 [Elusimicrobia bacterium GWF2_62_30]HBA61823.1 hypothetical protein [Elusimicrobiota bacterium]